MSVRGRRRLPARWSPEITTWSWLLARACWRCLTRTGRSERRTRWPPYRSSRWWQQCRRPWR